MLLKALGSGDLLLPSQVFLGKHIIVGLLAHGLVEGRMSAHVMVWTTRVAAEGIHPAAFVHNPSHLLLLITVEVAPVHLIVIM